MVASWDRKLARPINLKGGPPKRLVTLRDAGNYLHANFATVRRNAVLEGALEELVAAVETGEASAIGEATEQIHAFLADRDLAEPAPVQPGAPSVEQRLKLMLLEKRNG